jgi:hypothetical protein
VAHRALGLDLHPGRRRPDDEHAAVTNLVRVAVSATARIAVARPPERTEPDPPSADEPARLLNAA